MQDRIFLSNGNRKSIGGRKLSNSTYVSKSDPESALVARSGKPKALCHKVHYAADDKARVITSVIVTAGNIQDHEKLVEQLDYCRQVVGLAIVESVADKGYWGRTHLSPSFRARNSRLHSR